MSDNIELVSNYKIKKLEDICTITRGSSPRPMGDPKYFGGKTPFIKIADVTAISSKIILDSTTRVTELGVQKSRLLPKGTLIISNSATICVPKFLGVDACIHDGFVGLINFKEQVNLDYLYRYFEYIKPIAAQVFKQGVTQVNLNTEIFKNLPIPLPDFKTQNHLSKKIEILLSEIDAGVEELKKTKEKLELYKQSVLNAAIRGKLVPQDPKDEPASKLLERIRAEKEKLIKEGKIKKEKPLPPIDPSEIPFELPKGWEWVRLGDIVQIVSGFAFKSSDMNKKSGVPLVKIGNVSFLGFQEDGYEYLPEKYLKDYSGFIVENGDLLMALTRPVIQNKFKNCVYVGNEKRLLNQRVAMIKKDKYLYSYLIFLVKTPYFLDLILQSVTGVNQPNISATSIETFLIPVPSSSQLEKICTYSNLVLKNIDEVESIIEIKRHQIGHLKQSILKNAFEGKLI